MESELVLRLGRDALWTVLLVGAPMLGLTMVTGLVISVLQATTQINEQTLTFVPKILVVLAAGLLFGPWMLHAMVDYAASLLGELYRFIH